MKFVMMIFELVKEYYQYLIECSFFDEFIDYMIFGLVVYFVLVGEEVIDIVCKMVGVIKVVDVVLGMI